MSNVQALGQFFTTSSVLQGKVVEFVLNNPERVLEPSVGQGHLVKALLSERPGCRFDMFEIDPSISLLDGVPLGVIHGDFLSVGLSRKYTTIIGNPPFVRTSKGNLYIDFTERCFSLLSPGGELVFIVPSDFFKLTSSASLLSRMMRAGTFTHVFRPHDERLFAQASIDVTVFRYCLDPALPRSAELNGDPVTVLENKGLITFELWGTEQTTTFEDHFDVFVGMVTGKESVFRNSNHGNIQMLTGEGRREDYILLEEAPVPGSPVSAYLEASKPELMSRKIRSFNESNWFEWGAPRNRTTMDENRGKDCIYLHNMTRSDRVAFVGQVEYFGGSLLMLLPRRKMNLNGIVEFMNTETFRSNFLYSGRFKIGQGQLCKSSLPDRLVK
jgi:adenine-specific DNA-methyltransferase